jgi:3-oxoacyl-[acyl-carrier protein] reductase
MRNHMDLSGRVGLITGASSGIGAATATLFAELGAKVAVGYYHNEQGAEHVRASIAAAGGEAISIRADVRETDQIRMLVSRTTDHLGAIDILVNNAGSLIERQPVLEMAEERWDEVLNLNLKSALLCRKPWRLR